VLGPTKAAAFALHDEVPKGVSGRIDEMPSLQIATVGCRFAGARAPVEGIQRIEGIAKLAGETADRRRLLLEDLVFEDVQTGFRAHRDHPCSRQCRLKVTVYNRGCGRDAPPWRGATNRSRRARDLRLAWATAGENSMKLAGKIALVTGGSRGIGRATALAFAAEGADIGFCHLNDDTKAEETANEIRALGRRAMHGSVDVADIVAGRAFADQAARELGPIDILFNNAGMNIRKPFEAYSEAEFDRIVAVHLKGMFFMAQAVYPAMVARARGCIINVASQRGLKGAVNSAPYSAAKAAIMGFTRALAWEATPKGVRVNAIAPGPIVTDLTATMTPQDRQAFIDALPVGRFGRPEEIAATALLLAGPDGGFYVGATLSPNGGDVMY
jgi:3-oxoacyl-[acyl-carrier protein] reductase